MQPAIDLSAFLTKGQQYTFSLQPSGAVSYVYRPSLADVTAAIDGLPGVDSLAVAVQPASFFSISGDQFNVSFDYSGDGSDTVASMQGAMLDALSDLATGFMFIAAYGGGSGTPADTSGISEDLQGAADALKNTAGSLLPSTSAIWAIAILALVVVFFLSGGATVLKRATA